MVENTNQSNANQEKFPVYQGVASVKIVAINPNNAKLRELGRNIPEDAPEPSYMIESDKDGKRRLMFKIRFMAEIGELKSHPIIPLDFIVSKDLSLSKDNTTQTCMVMDDYGRSAWATKDDIKNKRIPTYDGKPVALDKKYRMAHQGEFPLISFIMKYLAMEPYERQDANGNWIRTAKPGRLYFDNWDALCNGDLTELAGMISLHPENQVKVVFGVRIDPETNKTFQTFMNTYFISNAAFVNSQGIYPSVQKRIEKAKKRATIPVKFSAAPVHEYKEQPSVVADNSVEDLPEETFNTTDIEEDDLPFDV